MKNEVNDDNIDLDNSVFFKILATAIMVICGLFMCVVLFSGCSPVKRLTRIAANHPEAAAVVCDRLYPVKENTRVEVRTVIDTQKIPGTTLYVNCDSIIKYRTDTFPVMVAVPCPPSQLITKMVTKDSIVTVESTARIRVLAIELQDATQDNEKLQHSRNVWMWVAIIAGGYLIIKNLLRIIFPAAANFLKYLP